MHGTFSATAYTHIYHTQYARDKLRECQQTQHIQPFKQTDAVQTKGWQQRGATAQV